MALGTGGIAPLTWTVITRKHDTPYMNGITHIEPTVKMLVWAVALFLLTFVVTFFY